MRLLRAARSRDTVPLVLMGGAGIAADVAMWQADHRDVDLAAAGLVAVLFALAAVTLRGRTTTLPARIAVLATKIVGCAAFLYEVYGTGILNALKTSEQHHGPVMSTAQALGVILLIVQVGQAATVSVRRDLALGAATACALLVEAGFEGHDATLAVAFGTALVLMVGGVATVLRAELAADSPASAHEPLLGGALTPVVRVTVVGALLFLVIPNSGHLTMRAQVAHASTAAAAGAVAHDAALAGPTNAALDLSVRGPLSPAAVFAAPADSPPYWQGSVYDYYDGSRWRITGPAYVAAWSVVSGTGPSRVLTAPAISDQPAVAPAADRTDVVRIVGKQSLPAVYAPGEASGYRGPGDVTVDADDNAVLRAPVFADGSTYAVTSSRPVYTQAQLESDHASDGLSSRWTQLPATMPSRVKQLGTTLAAGAASRPAIVAAVDDYLRHNEKYDINAPVPAAGQDAVDDFLFVSHTGFCEQFASAAVVLLRSAGVPARLVTGYAGGETSSGSRIMRGTDAHAWVQVWYPGIGWLNDDPTVGATAVAGTVAVSGPSATATAATTHATAGASSTGPAAAPGTTPAATSTVAATPRATTPAATPTAAATAPVHERTTGGGNRLPGGRLAVAGAVVLLALLGRMLLVALRRRRPVVVPDEPRRYARTGGVVLEAYSRLDEALTLGGRPASTAGAPSELLQRLTGLDADDVRDVPSALRVLERECYDVEPVPSAAAAAAAATFDRVVERLRRGPLPGLMPSQLGSTPMSVR
jgi:transglutaminase-like putative cysteine protease